MGPRGAANPNPNPNPNANPNPNPNPNQEGGWPWGLEERLRASAAQRGLRL